MRYLALLSLLTGCGGIGVDAVDAGVDVAPRVCFTPTACGDPCVPGTQRCNGNLPEVCDTAGEWVTDQDLGRVCP